jgi:O-antigen/teichoic acid export membrane protein
VRNDDEPDKEPREPGRHDALDIGGGLLAKNALLSLSGQLVPIVAVVVITPYLIGRLGEARSGILAVCLAILSSSTLLDLGLGRALRKRVAEALGRGERRSAALITTTTLGAQLGLGAIGALLLSLLAAPLAEQWLRIPAELQAEAKATFVIVAFALPVTVLLDSLMGVLEAAQRFDLVIAIRIPFLLSESLLPLYGIHIGWDLPTIAAVQLAVTVGFLVAYYVLSCTVVPELRRWPRVDRNELRKLFDFGKWIMVSNAVAPLLMYLDRLAIGAMIGMTAVTAYAAPYEAITRLSLVPASLAATLFPAFSSLSGQGRGEQLSRYASRSVRYLLLFFGPVIVVTMLFSRPILERWIGVGLAEDGALALSILAFGVLVNALAHVPFSVVQAKGRPDLTAKFHLIELPVHAVLVFLLVHLWGIPGAALAWTFRVSFDAVLLFAASAKITREEQQDQSVGVT